VNTCESCKYDVRSCYCSKGVSRAMVEYDNFGCTLHEARPIEFEAMIDTRPGTTGSYLLWASHLIPYGKYKVTLVPLEEER